MPSQEPTPSTIPPVRPSRWRRLTWPYDRSDNTAVNIEAGLSEGMIGMATRNQTTTSPAPGPPPRRNTHPFYNFAREFADGPKGWAYVSRSQSWFQNGPIHRRFGPSHQRLLNYISGRVAELEKRLLELDNEQQAGDSTELRGLSPWQRDLRDGEGKPILSEKDKILHDMIEWLDVFDRFLVRDAELRKMGQVDNCLVDTYVANTRKKKVLDESAMAQFVPIDDFVTTKNQTSQSIHASFERWIYDPHKGPIARFIMEKLFSIRDQPEGSTYNAHYNSDRIEKLFRFIAVLSVALPLMGPMSILYFAEPGKLASALVVIVPGLLVTWILASLQGRKFDQTFIASAAYLAVLGTFLANFPSMQRGN